MEERLKIREGDGNGVRCGTWLDLGLQTRMRGKWKCWDFQGAVRGVPGNLDVETQ